LARYVCCGPRKYDGRGRIDACSCEDGSEVRDAGFGVRGCEEDDVSHDSERRRSDDERSAFVRFLSKNSDDDSEDRGDCIGRDGQELGLCGGVAELADDGGEEEGECVQGERHCVEAEAVQPAFIVADSGADIRPGEYLVVGCVAVAFEARVDVGSFGLAEEGCGGGVVVDEEVSGEGDDDG